MQSHHILDLVLTDRNRSLICEVNQDNMLSDHRFIDTHLTILQLKGAVKVTNKREINKMDVSF